MRRFYTLLLYLLLPFILIRLLWRSIRSPAYRRRWPERFGYFPSPEVRGTLWIHAVSVGEVQAAAPLIKRLLAEHPEYPVVVTTTTPTGSVRVKRLFRDTVFHVYFPYDIPFAVSGFILRMRPRVLVMIETEIWPNLLAICTERGIPPILANARLSEASALGYSRLKAFSRETFSRIALVGAQTDADARRFIDLGVAEKRVRVTGSIKFDIQLPGSLYEQAEVLRRQWGNRLVWVAASTHEGEDERVLAAHRSILMSYPEAMLVLVPRHPERFDKVAGLCQKGGFHLPDAQSVIVARRLLRYSLATQWAN